MIQQNPVGENSLHLKFSMGDIKFIGCSPHIQQPAATTYISKPYITVECCTILAVGVLKSYLIKNNKGQFVVDLLTLHFLFFSNFFSIKSLLGDEIFTIGYSRIITNPCMWYQGLKDRP